MIERWSIDGITYCPVKKSDGAFVRHSDYAELAAENERLKQRLADHTRATSTVDAHETSNVSDKPEGQQEPVARGVVWFGYDENTGEFTGEYCSVKPHDARGMRPYIPYTTRPADQAVTLEKAAEFFSNNLKQNNKTKVPTPEQEIIAQNIAARHGGGAIAYYSALEGILSNND